MTLDALSGVLDNALAHSTEKNIDPAVIVATRLTPGMQPFRFQVQSVAFHAGATVEALKSGALSPPGPRPEQNVFAL